jgi:hypothetical protein
MAISPTEEFLEEELMPNRLARFSFSERKIIEEQHQWK